MKKILAILLLLVCVAGAAAFWLLRGRYVTMGGRIYPKDTQVLQLGEKALSETDKLSQFTGLRQLDLRGSNVSIQQYEALRSQLPDCEILWEVPFQGSRYAPETSELTVTSLTDEDVAALNSITGLTRLNADGCTDYAQLAALREMKPDCTITYQVDVCGSSCNWDVTELKPTAADADGLKAAIPLLPKLQTVDLRKSGISAEDALKLAEEFPEILFIWEFQIGEHTFSTDAEEIDISGTPVEDTAWIEQMVPHCKNLKKVIMCDCGMTNEDMDSLNQRHPDVQFVWNLWIGLLHVRTDDTYFAPIAHNFTRVYGDEEFAKLKYMTEVECVDLGHNQVPNIEWVRYMPKLKYLILADTPVTDISPLAGHPSLVWLEIFSTTISDYTPLTTCYALEDLNLGRTHGDPEPLAKMTWLKNLWWGDNGSEINLSVQNQLYRQKAEELLPKALPDTNVMIYIGAPTLKGWRDLPNYFKMRDAMHMFYMVGSTD